MKTISVTAMLLTAALAIGCSSGETTKDPGTGTPAPAPTTTSGTPDDTTPPADETPAPKPVKAPVIDEIMQMAGALHVTWTNTEPSCDTIELERKTATAPYKVVAKLPGEADNKHDSGATQAVMYTYRVRCKKADAYSPYSNEMSANPK
jgi:hypothetical protein